MNVGQCLSTRSCEFKREYQLISLNWVISKASSATRASAHRWRVNRATFKCVVYYRIGCWSQNYCYFRNKHHHPRKSCTTPNENHWTDICLSEAPSCIFCFVCFECVLFWESLQFDDTLRNMWTHRQNSISKLNQRADSVRRGGTGNSLFIWNTYHWFYCDRHRCAPSWPMLISLS